MNSYYSLTAFLPLRQILPTKLSFHPIVMYRLMKRVTSPSFASTALWRCHRGFARIAADAFVVQVQSIIIILIYIAYWMYFVVICAHMGFDSFYIVLYMFVCLLFFCFCWSWCCERLTPDFPHSWSKLTKTTRNRFLAYLFSVCRHHYFFH